MKTILGIAIGSTGVAVLFISLLVGQLAVAFGAAMLMLMFVMSDKELRV